MVDTSVKTGKTAFVAALIAIAVGVGVLVGWFFEIESLKRIAVGYVAMNPAAAVGFILSGTSLALLLWQSRGEGQESPIVILAARLCALGVALIGLSKLVAILTRWDPGVDQWLFHAKLADAFRLPNRLSPNAALKFLLLGCSLLGANAKNRPIRFGVEFSVAAVGFGSLLAVIGYTYGIESFYDIGDYIPIALPTALTFLALTAGLLLCHRDTGILAIMAGSSAGGTMARRLLPSAVVVPVVLGWLTLQGEKAGCYRWEIGEAMFVVASILIFTLLVCWSATGLFRADLGREKAEESLRKSEARYERIAANVPGMVYQFVLQPDGCASMPFVSEGCREIYGLEPEEIQRDVQLALEMMHPEDRLGFDRSVADSAASLQPWNWQGRLVRPDTGETRWIQAASRPERHPNGNIVWDGVLMDITERFRTEEHRRAKEEAERANVAKSAFLSRMSHELRTPLNAILGFGQLLELNAQTDKQHESVRHVIQGGRHLLKLIDEVLDMSRVESGHMALSLEPVPIHELVQETVSLIRPLAETHTIALLVCESDGKKAADRGLHVTADRQRLRQVLLNLLSNAVKYNVPGGRVMLEYTLAVDRLRLTVADTGPGIPADKRQRLFTPFDRLDAERGEVEGTGLGLALSKSLMEAMGGSLGLAEENSVSALMKTEENRRPGAAFFLEVPLAEDPLNAWASEEEISAREMARVEALPAGRTLLYIEDNLPNLTLIERLLEAHSELRLLTARQGTLGLNLAREHRPDLILLDLHLPDLTGLEVLKQLRADKCTRDIPTVIISADATENQLERLRLAGAHAYLTKPLDLRKFLSVVREILVKGQLSGLG
jgi:PAS domain S-box-containing protein